MYHDSAWTQPDVVSRIACSYPLRQGVNLINLTNFEDGVISSAFMVGLLVASPIFASSANSFNPFRFIGVGLTVWTFVVTLCGFSHNFWTIAVGRMLVSVGEASFISLAAPFIDDNAPVARSSKGKKRKMTSKSASDSDTPAKGSVKISVFVTGGVGICCLLVLCFVYQPCAPFVESEYFFF
ncbi:probable sphingolipid transporter spinster homolog 1 [Henckelia pumila]|uniref:probable sphingolipid transporter spinster homolog 1 n=1 Tax=Henckelia pumila TaxID=405737 RepID=UPI003C6E96C5